MRRNLAAKRVAILAALVCPHGAFAYSLSGDSWGGCPVEVTFYINPDDFPSSAGSDGDIYDAFEWSIDEWSAVGANITITAAATGASSGNDGVSVFLGDTGWSSSYSTISDEIRYGAGTTITECDSTFYGYTHGGSDAVNWISDGSPDSDETDLRSAFLNEVGSCLGLDSSATVDSAMDNDLFEGETHSMTTDDEAGLVAIYGDICDDVDGDGYYADSTCGSPSGDCDDCDSTVNPGETESCNGEDDDCDGDVDESGGYTWSRDADGDGYGDSTDTEVACDQPAGYVIYGTDCDDADASINPAETETCNGVDDDCDGTLDEGLGSTWYRDSDGDGYGDSTVTADACSAPTGYVSISGDCDDGNASVLPGAIESCNLVDDNCDGSTDEGFDVDGDGYTSCSGDCDDLDPLVSPAEEEWCNEVDDDCDDAVDEGFDVDADGYTSCSGDCDDLDPLVSPAEEEWCNEVDDDCDDAVDEGFDVDADGYTSCSGDCDDADEAVNPASEESCNEVDDDCDDAVDEGFDVDADGYTSCSGDCDDADEAVNPASEESCNAVDDDCDGAVDEGFDVDEDGYTSCGGDCEDSLARVNPGALEQCDEMDDDCDGAVDEGFVTTWYADADGDGFGDESVVESGCLQPPGFVARGGDCDDTNWAVHPGQTDHTNGVDADCDGGSEGSVLATDECGCASSGAPGTWTSIALALALGARWRFGRSRVAAAPPSGRA